MVVTKDDVAYVAREGLYQIYALRRTHPDVYAEIVKNIEVAMITEDHFIDVVRAVWPGDVEECDE